MLCYIAIASAKNVVYHPRISKMTASTEMEASAKNIQMYVFCAFII